MSQIPSVPGRFFFSEQMVHLLLVISAKLIVQLIGDSIDTAIWQALGNRNGGEVVGEF